MYTFTVHTDKLHYINNFFSNYVFLNQIRLESLTQIEVVIKRGTLPFSHLSVGFAFISLKRVDTNFRTFLKSITVCTAMWFDKSYNIYIFC